MMDTVEKFKFKADIFENDFKRYLDGREDSINLLNKYVKIQMFFILKEIEKTILIRHVHMFFF